MNFVETKLIDRTDLIWSKTRKSSGTAGSFLKAEELVNGRKIYYKLSNFVQGQGVIGHECVNEIIVDRLLTLWEVPHLNYSLINMKINVLGEEVNAWVCASKDFKNKGESKIPLDLWYEMESEKDEKPLEFCIRKGFADYIYHMLAVDFIIMNRDRHGANIELLKDNNSKTFRLAPLFDHGLSLILENDSARISSMDISETKKVQCFVGNDNPEYNIGLIPKEKMPYFRPLTKADKVFLFTDLETAMSRELMEKTWEFITYRRNWYESIRNQK